MPQPSPEASAMLAKVFHINGEPLNEPRTLAWHPLLLKRFALFAGVFLAESVLPARDRELLTLRSIYRAGSEYLFGHHQLSAPDAGVSAEEIAGVTGGDHNWSPRDALLLRVADELSDGTDLPNDVWRELTSIYDEAQLVEAVMLVGFYRMVCGFIVTLRIQREEGVPGWPDDPEVPASATTRTPAAPARPPDPY